MRLLLHSAQVVPIANVMALYSEGIHDHRSARRKRACWWRIAVPFALVGKAISLLPKLRAAFVLNGIFCVAAPCILFLRAESRAEWFQ